MKKVKFVIGTDITDLNNALNDYLKSVPEKNMTINYDLENLIVIVEHSEDDCEKVCRCCDCQHYDPSEDRRGAWGLCHRKGIRTRFNAKKCESYEDVRC